MTTTQTETAEALWAKIGRKRYQHTNGTVVFYDCNSFMWVIEGKRVGYQRLWVAQEAVENGMVP